MTDPRTITIDLHDIRTRAEAVLQTRHNRNTTTEEELRTTMYNLERAIGECRLAEYALKIERSFKTLAVLPRKLYAKNYLLSNRTGELSVKTDNLRINQLSPEAYRWYLSYL